MLRIKKQLALRAMVLMLVGITVFSVPLSAAQTLGELEKEIEQIKADTEKQLEEQEEIEAEKVSTETDIADVKADVAEINLSISNKEAEIYNKNTEIETQNGKIEEIQDEIPQVKADADMTLQALQKAENGNVMIEMVLSPTENEEDNILRRINSVNRIAEFAGDTVLELVEIEKELQYEKTVLEKDQAELEASQAELETQEKQLTVKEAELEQVLENQTDASTEIENSVAQAAEDQAMLEDTLAYYQSYGCSQDDLVGSKCGGLADDDGDGVVNNDDSCPNEYGQKANGCPDGSESGGGSSSGGGGSGSASSFIRPLAHGVITTEFGGYGGHTGTDMDNADSDPILATANGVVITAAGGCAPWGGYIGNTCNGGYGNYVMLMHNTSNGVVFSLYGHMSSITVSPGQTVSQGQQLGTLGHSGNSSGSHLHFEVYADSNGNGLPDDPKTDARYYVSFPARWTWW